MEHINDTNNVPTVVSNTVGSDSSTIGVHNLRVSTKPTKFDAIKIYRSYHTISGSFKGLKDFAHNAYKQRLFRTLPGTTYIVFDDNQSWFPTEQNRAKTGTDLYTNLANRNNHLFSISSSRKIESNT